MKQLATFLEAIKFSHSVFALPFALIAMLAAGPGWPGFWTLFWIVAACVAARTAAMAFNRLIDADVDAANPRTRNRALVTGELSRRDMAVALVASSLAFFFAAGMLNRLCLLLSPPTLLVLLGYSYTKRFTDFSHLVLGLALGLAPMGAWVAVTGSIAFAPMLLAGAVLFWVAGFDILYSCQDYEFDRSAAGLHSLPKRLGIRGAMRLARRFHGATLLLLLLFWLLSPFGGLFLLGVGAVGLLLIRQHALVSPRDLSRIDAAFFTTNGVISVGLFFVAAIDLALLGGAG
ncbi:MAG: UbiA-like polyprenyltransferase [Candidatus Sumerlaeia bacterium]|nr:UbiA-like polyprenyltransferase [Candidatus Sumerlaeia bacterium]